MRRLSYYEALRRSCSAEMLQDAVTQRQEVIRWRRWKAFIACGITFGVIIALIIVTQYYYRRLKHDICKVGPLCAATNATSGICDADVCIDAAADLETHIDTTVDLCEDFYAFACSANATAERATQSAFEVIKARLARSLHKAIVAKSSALQHLKSVRLTRHFYIQCLATTGKAMGRADQRLLRDLEQYGGWPMAGQQWNETDFSLEALVGAIAGNESVSTILAPTYSIDWTAGQLKYVLYIDEAELVHPAEFYLQPQKFQAHLLLYRDSIVEAAKRLWIASHEPNEEPDEQQMQSDADQIIVLETDIAKLMTLDGSAVSLESVQLETDQVARLWSQSFAAQNGTYDGNLSVTLNELSYFNWRKFFTSYLSMEESDWNSLDPMDISKVVIIGHEFIKKFGGLYQSRLASARSWQNYLLWRIIRNRAVMQMPEMSRDPDTMEVFKRQTAIPERTSFCLRMVKESFPWTVSRMFAVQQNTTDTRLKPAIAKLADDIFATSKKLISELSWMSTATKLEAATKLKRMKLHLGQPDWIFNDSALEQHHSELLAYFNYDVTSPANQSGPRSDPWSRLDFFRLEEIIRAQNTTFGHGYDTPSDFRATYVRKFLGDLHLDANAYHLTTLNSAVIPLPIMQPSLFDADYPDAMNFGRLGYVIGHEVGHGYDRNGVLFSGEGNHFAWLDSNTSAAFEDLGRCLANQYDQFCFDGPQQCVNGARTLSENLADHFGLSVAWEAFKANETVNATQSANQLPFTALHFSDEQLFFLAFSNLWCQDDSKTDIDQLLLDSHAPERWRVNGVLQNFQPFAEAWQCAAGTAMAPTKRCKHFLES